MFAGVVFVASSVLGIVESMFYRLVTWYDDYFYTPLQIQASPFVAWIPRQITIHGVTYTVFSANIVSYSRTVLVVPIVWLVTITYHYSWTAFSLVALHDFLDNIDGIVAKVHKRIYGPVDDPLFGGFIDAFCDKIVNVTSLWSLLLLTDYRDFTSRQMAVFIGVCAVIIIYEFVLGVVRVQDYFSELYARYAHHDQFDDITENCVLLPGACYIFNTNRKYKTTDRPENYSPRHVSSVMAGKLKETLESVGIACLCLSHGAAVVTESLSGLIGVTCLLLSIRLAHASLQHKLTARAKKQKDSVSGINNHDTFTTHAVWDKPNADKCNMSGSVENLEESVAGTHSPNAQTKWSID